MINFLKYPELQKVSFNLSFKIYQSNFGDFPSKKNYTEFWEQLQSVCLSICIFTQSKHCPENIKIDKTSYHFPFNVHWLHWYKLMNSKS